MANLNLFTSNRLEVLSRHLATILRNRPLSSPLAEEVLVVQSAGMKRWLSLEMARQSGICANARFVFPNMLLQEVLAAFFPDEFPGDLLNVEVMTWKLMPLLDEMARHKKFAAPAKYLSDGNERKRYQLAARLADTFDQYLVYRPEMIFDWEAGAANDGPENLSYSSDERWQAHLWRQVSGRRSSGHDEKTPPQIHRAAWWRKFIKLSETGRQAARLPERVSIFGISTLPVSHVQFLQALSRYIDVDLYIMNPCRKYWGDILSEAEMQRLEKKAEKNNIDPVMLHLEQGNPLLASMGTVARDFFDMLHDFDCREDFQEGERERPLFVSPGRETLLSCIQADILDLVPPTGQPTDNPDDGEPETLFRLSETDRSVSLSACHSPMREVEVLHDALLDMFENNPSLTPEDVLVMAPDIESYVPYIEAVFSARPDAIAIPHTVADRSPRSSSPVIESMMSFFSLFCSRFEADAVLALLEPAFVRRCFDLSENDVTQIRRWITGTGVRWGIDAGFKAEAGLPAFSENTWQAGLDRLLLGWALPDEGGGRLFAGVLPWDDMEGSGADVLQKFLRFWERLVGFRKQFGGRHILDEWREILLAFTDTFFVADDATEADIQLVRQLATRLGELQREAGFDDRVGQTVIERYLMSCLDRAVEGASFIAGGVTFCSLLPMRSIPFSVVCLLGMNSDDYPRRNIPSDFDLIARKPRRGDRSRRNDDRYLFLEALLSARRRFYISYVGFDIKDNSPRPPSPLVSELIDYIRTRCGLSAEDGAFSDILTRHRLQPFNPDYYITDSGLFSYSPYYHETARTLVAPPEKSPRFSDAVLAVPADESGQTILLDDLCLFFENPVKYFLNRCLSIRLEDRFEQIASSEPFEIYGLEQYAVNQRLIELRLAGRTNDDIYETMKAAGSLPHGEPGRCRFDAMYQAADGFIKRVQDHIGERTPVPMEIDLDLDGWRLVGTLNNIYDTGWFKSRYAKTRPIDRLSAWLLHLVLGADDNNLVRQGCWAGQDNWFTFSAVADSRAQLQSLLEIYQQGLVQPLHFFPQAAYAYAEALQKNSHQRAGLNKALLVWGGGRYQAPEGMDPWYRLCFGKTVPIDGAFEELAQAIFTPLLEHMELLP